MTASLLALLLTYSALSAHVDLDRVSYETRPTPSVTTPEGVEVLAYTICYLREGRAEVVYSSAAGVPARLHELVHVVDCQDDGIPNGSPYAFYGWMPDDLTDPERAEWAAGAITVLAGAFGEVWEPPRRMRVMVD